MYCQEKQHRLQSRPPSASQIWTTSNDSCRSFLSFPKLLLSHLVSCGSSDRLSRKHIDQIQQGTFDPHSAQVADVQDYK